MSFDVFLQRFERGRPAGAPEPKVRAAFGKALTGVEGDLWRVEYGTDSADVLVVRDGARGELVQTLCVNRPCADPRLWEAIYAILKSGPWVLFYPDEPPSPLMAAARRSAEAAPADMRAVMGPVRVVRSAGEIMEIVSGNSAKGKARRPAEEFAGPARKPARTNAAKRAGPAEGPKLLSGGNPQIAKGHGEAPVKAYIAAMPGWKREIGRRLDRIITKTVPGVRKAVKWNSPLYGVEGRGWFLSIHCFTNYVKVAFFRGAHLDPPPPGTSKQKDVRYLDIREGGLDEARFAEWVRQAAALPGEEL